MGSSNHFEIIENFANELRRRMKKIVSIMALMLLHISCFAVTVETTANLNVYYPEYTKMDLVCGQMPKAAQKDVEFCCEAAFTGELLLTSSMRHPNHLLWYPFRTIA